MTIAAIVLILISVVLHVGWNTISKHVVPTAAFFLVAMLISAVALTPILIWLHASVGTVLLEVWPLLLATSFFAALYNVALASAYRAGDLSLVYPLARSLAPLGVALISVALGRGAEIGVGCLAGIAIIVLGSALLPLDDWTGLALERFRSKAFAGALLTATATAGYTVLDDEALRWLRGSEALELGPARISLVYAAFHAWVTTPSGTIPRIAAPRGRPSAHR